MTIKFHHLRAALKSAAHFRQSLSEIREETPAIFDGAKTGTKDNPDATRALGACSFRGLSLAGEVDRVACKALLDAVGPGMIIRQITMPKEAPSAELAPLENLIQRWHLDLQMALDMELRDTKAWYAWIFQEPQSPYACQLVTPSAPLLEKGREKLKKALAVIKASNETNSAPAYSGILVAGLPKWAQEITQ